MIKNGRYQWIRNFAALLLCAALLATGFAGVKGASAIEGRDREAAEEL